jgi:hypothetical protein
MDSQITWLGKLPGLEFDFDFICLNLASKW